MPGKKKRGPVAALTSFGFFTLTASMLMSADEYPAFAQSGMLALLYLVVAGVLWFLPTALCSAEMATVKGWEEGGVFTWVKGTLGERWGFLAIFMQWLQNALNFVTMIYVIIGALSMLLDLSFLNDNHLIKFLLFLVIYWGLTLAQLGGIRQTDRIVKVAFIGGIVVPSFLLMVLAMAYLGGGGQPAIDVSLSAQTETLSKGVSITTLVPFFLAFAGIEASASYASEMKNPGKQYPIAILVLVVFAVGIDAMGGLSIALTVPVDQLTLNTGVIQAVQAIIGEVAPHMGWFVKVMTLLLMLGMVGEVSSWIVGPVRTLYATAQDGLLPRAFNKLNRHKVPVPLVIMQGVVITAINAVLTLILGGNNAAFQIAMSMTAMVYMITYVLIFVGYLQMTFKQPGLARSFHVGRGRFWKVLVAGVGLIVTFVILAGTLLPVSSLTGVPGPVYTAVTGGALVAILVGVQLYYNHMKKHPPAQGAKPPKPRHLHSHEVNRFVFPKNRSAHWLED